MPPKATTQAAGRTTRKTILQSNQTGIDPVLSDGFPYENTRGKKGRREIPGRLHGVKVIIVEDRRNALRSNAKKVNQAYKRRQVKKSQRIKSIWKSRAKKGVSMKLKMLIPPSERSGIHVRVSAEIRPSSSILLRTAGPSSGELSNSSLIPIIVDPDAPPQRSPLQRKVDNLRQKAAQLPRQGLIQASLLRGEAYDCDHILPFYKYRMPEAIKIARYQLAKYHRAMASRNHELGDVSLSEGLEWDMADSFPWLSYDMEFSSLLDPIPYSAWMLIGHYHSFEADEELRMMYHLALFLAAANHGATVIPRIVPVLQEEGPCNSIYHWERPWSLHVPAGYDSNGSTQMDNQEARTVLTRKEVLWEFQAPNDENVEGALKVNIAEAKKLYVKTIKNEYKKWEALSKNQDLWEKNVLSSFRIFEESNNYGTTANMAKARKIKRALRRLLKILTDDGPEVEDFPDDESIVHPILPTKTSAWSVEPDNFEDKLTCVQDKMQKRVVESRSEQPTFLQQSKFNSCSRWMERNMHPGARERLEQARQDNHERRQRVREMMKSKGKKRGRVDQRLDDMGSPDYGPDTEDEE